ncbi:bifunctional metallophosphatase/5'-nucleotidase [Bacillus sp. REN16]|uniref:bifunctional metallophosphatase/5'-nucleotidase n=1 Tax=Bacillus sp. REN16 TaxID=2887296 RepID=UPI001E4B3E41|nr:bifunctional metallophosphatase/5'-nucleotidase [Bacillus sp. REN16]MCC3358656.1 bifunctional metallophosphatase/5'-nucleotidase [Bacillus sp. REN16]
MKSLTITVLETSDVHGNIFPINYGNNEAVGLGLAKIATVIKEERRKNRNTIVVDNGDLIQGTPFTYHYVRSNRHKPNPMITLLNDLNYDAAVIGNHEFNYGMEVLQQAIYESNFPWLSANILDEDGEPFIGKPYTIIELEDGIKAAILGVTTHYIPNWENPEHIKGLTFDDAFESTKKWVEKIHNQENPDVMIVSYHGGFEANLETGEPTEKQTGENQGYRIVKEIEGIDLLLTGHQHRSLSGKINGVPIVQPSFNGQAIGKVSFTLTKNNGRWAISDSKPELILVDELETDESSLQLVYDYESDAQDWLDQPIGQVKGNMTIDDPLKARLKDNALVEFINKVQLDVAKVSISATAFFNNVTKGFPSNITMRDIVSNYIYPNTLKVIRICGKDLKEALERSASYFMVENGEVIVNPSFTTPKPQHYNYDMWEGIDYIFDISKPIGKRVVELTFKGEPIQPDGQYDVVMNNYRAGGGGEYIMFKDKPIIKDIPLDMSELIANYILERGTIEATVDENWKVIW